jgi:hypothetical protein
MQVTNNITQSNGIIIVQMQALFVGDPTDASDKQKISAFGDPLVNMAGRVLADPNNPGFSFGFQTNDLMVGITTQMQNNRARFLTQLPLQKPSYPNGQPPTWFAHDRDECRPLPQLQPLDCVIANDAAQNEAVTAWIAIMVSRIQAAMAILRNQVILPNIPYTTV